MDTNKYYVVVCLDYCNKGYFDVYKRNIIDECLESFIFPQTKEKNL